MSTMASLITSITIVYSIIYSGTDQRKLPRKFRVTDLCAGNSSVTGEFPAQRTSNAKIFPFDDVIMVTSLVPGCSSDHPIASKATQANTDEQIICTHQKRNYDYNKLFELSWNAFYISLH